MNYIKVPDEIYLSGNENRKKVVELNNEYKSLKNTKEDILKKEEISKKIAELKKESTVKINDKIFINKLLNDIHNSKGIKENIILKNPNIGLLNDFFNVQFIYNDVKTSDINKLKEGYVFEFIIFNNQALIPKYSKNTKNNISFVRVELSNNTLKYIENYYNSKK
ncbi:hypothetical protein ACETAC_05940 [Aceticella autotrophica]|uniref:Uncharacterized protein n=1 Tax=Aceticella autotrophica TaxID=2755338 RepID=A0A974Y2U9_9THEO|nr:hypothetical protein [Aceticella autotrophica]QSZ26465.1 hypothetical protein ACETAC_05940 [Aceticella autotrophica]